MLLTWLFAIPAIGGAAAWVAGHRSALVARLLALAASLTDFGLALWLWADFPFDLGRHELFIQHKVTWIPEIGLNYYLALDGLSLILVLLTCVIGIIAVLCSWREITYRVGDFHLALMVLLASIIGTFLAFDLLLFYFFWESMLVPVYFLIAIWGHENRRYAAMKFFLFTFIAGFFMLIGILGIYFAHARQTGLYSFDYLQLLGTHMSANYALWLMLGFLVGLAVKMPIVPLHTWLPDAHTEAPTAGSVDLAGLLLKTGAYGLMRFAIPLFPDASARFAPIGIMLGVAGIIYGAVMAYPQHDFKRMVAYTSISHMGFVLLGIYTGNQLALQGALLAIVAHGISTGALFLIAGMTQERTYTRDLVRLGGLWATAPKLGGFTLFFALAALGLPGLANFLGEFLILLGAFQISKTLTVFAALGMILSTIYALRLVQKTVLGPNENNWVLADLSVREIGILGGMAALILWLGLYPQPVFRTAKSPLDVIQSSLHRAEIQEKEVANGNRH